MACAGCAARRKWIKARVQTAKDKVVTTRERLLAARRAPK